MSPAALLLDVDRTLVDLQGRTDYAAALADVEAALGEVELEDVPATDWGSVTEHAMAILVSLNGKLSDWQRASDLIEEHEAKAVAGANAMVGLSEFLDMTSGWPRALVTLIGPRALDMVADQFEIDVSVRVGRSAGLRPKPAPDQLLAACDLLGVSPSDAVFVGDSSWDEAAARAAKIKFVGVTNHGPSHFSTETTTTPDLIGVAMMLG